MFRRTPGTIVSEVSSFVGNPVYYISFSVTDMQDEISEKKIKITHSTL